MAELMCTCHLCPDGENQVSLHEVDDHLRVLHPDAYGDGPERWPDGEVVVHDMTLEPADFDASGQGEAP